MKDLVIVLRGCVRMTRSVPFIPYPSAFIFLCGPPRSLRLCC